MINEITRDNNSFLKFIKYASQFYKAKYYNFDNVLYLYEVCPHGRAFGKYEDWNGIDRRIKKGEHGYHLIGENNWNYVVFDISQTWGTPIRFQKFDKNKMTAIVDKLVDTYDLDEVNKYSENKSAFFYTIYDISMKNIEKKKYDFTDKEKTFVATTTALLVLNKCDYYINDLLDNELLSSINKNNFSYLLDTSYYFYKNIMFEVKDLEKNLLPLEKQEEIPVIEQPKEIHQTPEIQKQKQKVYVQPSLFGYEEEKEIINVLKKGNNFSKGDETIYRIMTTINDKNQAIKELRDSLELVVIVIHILMVKVVMSILIQKEYLSTRMMNMMMCKYIIGIKSMITINN